MKLPRGDLVRSRAVDDPGTTLAVALERSFTGYAVLEPQGTLLLEEERRGVLTFEDGVPVLAYDTTTDRGGREALAELSAPGPYRVELYELDADALEDAHDTPALTVPPGLPAEQVAGDPALATRTREAAPADRTRVGADDEDHPVAAFLADEANVEAIRERARREAAARAEEWGLDDQLAE